MQINPRELGQLVAGQGYPELAELVTHLGTIGTLKDLAVGFGPSEFESQLQAELVARVQALVNQLVAK